MELSRAKSFPQTPSYPTEQYIIKTMECRVGGRCILPRPPSTTIQSFSERFHWVTPSDVAIVQSKPRQPKSPRKPESEWENHRHNIIHLYIDERLSLREVMEKMREDHGFVASKKQYNTKIIEWKIQKKIKADEKRAMIRKQQNRKAANPPKKSTFRIRNQWFDDQKVEQFQKDKGITDITTLSDAGTPSDISCFTPKSEAHLEDELLMSLRSHLATPTRTATEFGLNFRTPSASPPLGIRADTPGPTSIHRHVSQEACMDPSVLENYRPALSSCEWWMPWVEYKTESNFQEVDVHPVSEALRILVIPVNTRQEREVLDKNWESIKRKLSEIVENDLQTNKHLLEQGCLGCHPDHFLNTLSMDNTKITARENLVYTRGCLSLYLHALHCPLCRPGLSMDSEGWEKYYPVSVTAEAVLNLRDANFEERLHYSWCIFNSICLPGSDYEYLPFARSLFRLLVQEFSRGSLARKSACIDIARYYVQWGEMDEAFTTLKQVFGQDFGFVLWLAQLRGNAHVVLDRPGWNEVRYLDFGPHWTFPIIPQIQYDIAVTILRCIPGYNTRSWDGTHAKEFSDGFSGNYFNQRLKHGFDEKEMGQRTP